MEDSALEKSIQYIEAHLKEELSLCAIASHAGYSVYHFSRLFRRKMQCSVMDYVRKRKLYKASEAIIEGRKIVDVAYEYGWQSHNSFTRGFKAEYGFPPAYLRAIHLTLTIGGAKMKPLKLVELSEDKTKEELLEVLKEMLSENQIRHDERELNKAYDLCCQAYEGIKRHSGSEYATHLLHVAILLADMGAPEKAIYAGMFCDVQKKAKGKEGMLENSLSEPVWTLVKEVNMCKDMGEGSDENVLLIKLAERLHNMRTIEFMEECQAREKAKETFDVFLPIARKMKNEKLCSELNDLAARFFSGGEGFRL